MELTPASASSRLHYGWIVLTVSTLVVFGALGLSRFSYTAVLPAMQTGLAMNNTQAGVVATFSLIGYLSLSVIGGALAARFGPRAVISTGLLLAGIGMLLTGQAARLSSAVIWQTLTGIGSGASNVPVMGLLAAWFVARRRGMAAGIAVSGASLGIIVVGPLVPRILSVYGETGWRSSWHIFGGITIVVAVLGWVFLRNQPETKGLSPIGKAKSVPKSSDTHAGAIRWGEVYRSTAVWHLGLVYIAFGFAYIIYLTFFTKHLMAEGGYTQQAAGTLFMIMGWSSLLCGLIWGTVSDVIGRKQALVIVYLIHAASFSLFALWPTSSGFTISAVLFGLTAWSIPAIIAATCGDVLGPRLAPAALGFTTLFFGVGQAIGPSIAGVIADTAGSFSPAFLLAGGVSLLGAVGTSLLRSLPEATDQ